MTDSGLTPATRAWLSGADRRPNEPVREGQPQDAPPQLAEDLAQAFHAAYERLAPDFGYKTREASAKPWADVPDGNRALMTAVAGEILAGPVAALVESARVETAGRIAAACEAYADKLRAGLIPGIRGGAEGELYRAAAAMHYDYAARIARETR